MDNCFYSHTDNTLKWSPMEYRGVGGGEIQNDLYLKKKKVSTAIMINPSHLLSFFLLLLRHEVFMSF